MVNNQQKVTTIFAALSDPTRRAILVRLSNGAESPVTALARPFHMSLPAVSRHLRVLESARLVVRRRKGRMHLIRARPEGLKDAQAWIDRCEAAWNYSFDTLSHLLKHQNRKDSPP